MRIALPALSLALLAGAAAAGERAPLALVEHEDPYSRVAGLSSYLEEHGIPFVRPGPRLDPRGLRAVLVGAFASSAPAQRRWLQRNAAALSRLTRQGGTVIVLAQADQDQARPGFIGSQLEAARGDRDSRELVTDAPADDLFRRRFRVTAADLARLEVGQERGALARDIAGGVDLFTEQRGFRVLARTADGAPAILHGALGRGQVLLLQLAPDKVYDLPADAAAARAATRMLANLVALCLEPGPVPEPSSPIARAADRAVSGHVFWDDNASGRPDPGEPPAAGVSVFLGRQRARTDRQGRYRLSLPADRSSRLGLLPPSGARAPASELLRGWEPGGTTRALPLQRDARRAAERFSFVVLSDLHLMSGRLAKQQAQLAVRLARLAREKPAFGILLGDSAATSRADELGALRALLDTAPFPMFALPGNHDETLGPDRLARYEAMVEVPFASFEWGKIHFVLGRDFNTAEARAWLDAELKTVARGQEVVLCQHDPPTPRLLARLRKAKVTTLLHGHLHRGGVRATGGVQQFSLPPALFGGLDRSPAGYGRFDVDGIAVQGALHSWAELTRAPEVTTTPRPAWTRALEGRVRAPPAAWGGQLLVPLAGDGLGGGTRGVAALRVDDGSLLWRADTAAPVLARPTGAGSGAGADGHTMVYVQEEDGAVSGFDAPAARTPGSGGPATVRRAWRREPPGQGASFVLAPPAATDRGVLRTAPSAPALLSRRGGGTLWQSAGLGTAAVPSFTGGALHGDTLLISSGRHGLVALDAGTGARRWASEPMAATAPPASDGTRAFVVTAGELVALDLRDGSELWAAPLPYAIHTAPPVASGEWVLQATGRGTLVALDGSSGVERWRVESQPALAEIGPYRRGGPSGGAPPCLRDGQVLYGTDDGVLRWIRIADGGVIRAAALGAPVSGCAAAAGFDVAALLDGRVLAFGAPGPERTEP